jgi:hypothetical protein
MATYIPTKNTDPTKAVYGESSSGVSALQQSLNAANAGKAGYVPLKVDGKYGPLTQAASSYAAPEMVDIGGGAMVPKNSAAYTNYVTNIQGKGSAGSAPLKPQASVPSEYYSRKDALTDIVTDMGEKPDLAKIRDELTTNNQAIIDSIKAQYAGTIAQEQKKGEVLNKRQRGLNVGAGLGGSDFAGANTQQVEDATLEAIRAVEQERDAKIAATLAGVEFRASQMFQERKDAYTKKAEDSLTAMSKFKDEALSDIANFAASGLSAKQLREQSPETWRALLEQTGYDETGLTAAFVSNKPEPDFKEKVGNSLIYGYRDPQTGKITTEKVELPSGYDSFERVGDKYAFINTSDGTFKYAEGMVAPSSSSSSGKVYKDGGLSLTGSQLNEIEQELQKSKSLFGGDGKYVNPELYQQTLQDWIDNKGTQQGFLAKFPPNKYINPANTQLPIYLQNITGRAAIKASTTGPTVKNPFATVPQ